MSKHYYYKDLLLRTVVFELVMHYFTYSSSILSFVTQ